MAIKHYKGFIGEFDYDTTQFELADLQSFFNILDSRYYLLEFTDEQNNVKLLKYIGSETDGSKIKIPEGILYCTGMFAGTDLETPVKLPSSVVDARCIYYASNLKEFSVFDADIIATGACGNCKNLSGDLVIDAPQVGLYSFQYVACSNIRSVSIKCDSLVNHTRSFECAFEGCHFLESFSCDFKELSFDVVESDLTENSDFNEPFILVHMNHMFGDCMRLRSCEFNSAKYSDRSTPFSADRMFDNCSSLIDFHMPFFVKYHDHMFLGCSCLDDKAFDAFLSANKPKYVSSGLALNSGLIQVHVPSSVTEISDHAFFDSRLNECFLPDGLERIGRHAFGSCNNLNAVWYKGNNIRDFLNFDSFGIDNFRLCKTFIDKNIPLTRASFQQGTVESHAGTLRSWLDYYPLFGSVSSSTVCDVFGISRRNYDSGFKFEPSVSDIRDCRDAFINNSKFHGHYPKCITDVIAASEFSGIGFDELADHFDLPFMSDVVRSGKPFIPAIVSRCYYDRSTCENLYKKGLDTYIADIARRYNKTSDDRVCDSYKNAMDFITTHMNTGVDNLVWLVKHADVYDIPSDLTSKGLRKLVDHDKYSSVVEKLENAYSDYGFKLSDCKCDLHPLTVKYRGRTSRILNFDDENDRELSVSLGIITDCCQQLGSAGESAMMHGLLNPDAGFFVIEDKNGQVKAQAEIWLADQDTLVFDNIEFTNTSSEGYKTRVDALRGDIAVFAANSQYKNIVMGCGYNEFHTDGLISAPVPKLKLTPYEVYALQADCDVRVSFKDVAEAEEYMSSRRYNPDHFVYTDVDKRDGTVYIKKDGLVSDYFVQPLSKEEREANSIDIVLEDRYSSVLNNDDYKQVQNLRHESESEFESESDDDNWYDIASDKYYLDEDDTVLADLNF